MAGTVLSARLPERELAIAAWKAGLTDASIAEIARYSVLRLAGHSHDDAKNMALSGRTTVEYSDAPDRLISVRIPDEWLEAARLNVPDASSSVLFRYSLTRLTTADDTEAMRLAMRKPGRPFKSEQNVA